MNILLIGAGSVGQGFLKVLALRSQSLQESHGFVPRIVGVVTRSKGTLFDEAGLPLDALRTALQNGHLDLTLNSSTVQRNPAIQTILQHSAVDIVVEASPTNVQTGQPALDYIYTALNHGKHVVLANKGPLVVDGIGLMRCAESVGKALDYEATVMAGTPAIRLATKGLPGAQVTGFRGILNGTTNFILTKMSEGGSFDEALAEAQRLGYAETDPSGDVDGWDAAAKVIILSAAIFGVQLTFEQLSVSGIGELTSSQIQQAKMERKRWKLIAEGTREGGRVHPVALPVDDPLANVNGTLNAVTYTTDINGDVTLVGAGAGGQETGFALFSNLLEIYEQFF
jgi:homoserine dehydrogenase